MLRYIFLMLYFATIFLATRGQNKEMLTLLERRNLHTKGHAGNEDAPMTSSVRGIAEFGLMILCATGRFPLDYVGYGCYCGLGGRGKPVDETDRCCQIHDECYTRVQKSGYCPFSWSVYVLSYRRNGCYGCKPPSYYWFYGKCRYAMCYCDSQAVQCFKRSKFNPNNMNYPKSKC